MAQQRNQNVRFIRRGGRIIPIRGSKRAAKDITSNKRELATIMGAVTAGFGGAFAAGKLEKKSQALSAAKQIRKSNLFNRSAKFLKFGSKAVPGLIAASALVAIDRKSRDEGTVFDIGNTSGAFNVGVTLLGGFAAARVFKRFEKFGLRGGKFPIKLRDI